MNSVFERDCSQMFLKKCALYSDKKRLLLGDGVFQGSQGRRNSNPITTIYAFFKGGWNRYLKGIATHENGSHAVDPRLRPDYVVSGEALESLAPLEMAINQTLELKKSPKNYWRAVQL